MSRLTKKPIIIPEGVTVEVGGDSVKVKGPKGELSKPVLSHVALRLEGKELWVDKKGTGMQADANIGTMWSLLTNAIEGVVNGFKKVLEIEGIGYRAVKEGTALVLSLGFSHPVRFEVPKGVEAVVEKSTIVITGIDKEAVGQVAAEIRSYKKPEPYQGKGIRYRGEVVRRKVGKKAATAGAA